VPQGYFTFTSSTYNVFLFFRTIMGKGAGKPDPAPAVANAEQTRVYPLWGAEKDLKPMTFPNASGKPVNMMYPVDYTYWTKLKEFVDYNRCRPSTRRRAACWRQSASSRASPSNRRSRRRPLEKAVTAAPRMILAMRQLGRPDGCHLYYKDRQYENAWCGATAENHQETYLDIDQRAAYYQYAYSSASAMAMRTLGAGSKYPYTTRDANGEFLNGSNTYKLHLPPNAPASLFWAVTLYNITDGTMPETEQLLPSTNGYYDLPKNKDGSIDIWCGPAKPDGVADAAFLQTVPDRHFLVALRLYGTGVEFFDQTWKPDDVVKVKQPGADRTGR
jgi:hypothetical protein